MEPRHWNLGVLRSLENDGDAGTADRSGDQAAAPDGSAGRVETFSQRCDDRLQTVLVVQPVPFTPCPGRSHQNARVRGAKRGLEEDARFGKEGFLSPVCRTRHERDGVGQKIVQKLARPF